MPSIEQAPHETRIRYDSGISYLLIFASAFAVCVLLHFLALTVFPRAGLLDFPERYGQARARLPYPTGILMIVGFFLLFLATHEQTLQSVGMLAGILILGIYSFCDDRSPLPSRIRLMVQVLVGFVIFATGSRIYTITNPLEGIASIGAIIKLDTVDIPTVGFGPLPLWSGVFTVCWLLLTVNALNWFDGIPGQVSALSVIGFLTIGFLAMSDRVQQPALAFIAFMLAGISCGALLFDFPPSKVLMGDTGAMFLGLMLGVLTIYAGGKVATAFLVLGVPLIDSVLVILLRLRRGRSVFRGSQSGEHLHHRLLAKGWSPRRVIFLTAALGMLFGVTALFLSTQEKFLTALVLFGIMVLLRRMTSTEPDRDREH